jgi:glutaredoxin-like protein NrdH
MSVTVWSKPKCVQCNAVKLAFDRAGVPYTEKMLNEFPGVLARFVDHGHLSAPVVEATGVETFSGFNPHGVKEIIDLHSEIVPGPGAVGE